MKNASAAAKSSGKSGRGGRAGVEARYVSLFRRPLSMWQTLLAICFEAIEDVVITDLTLPALQAATQGCSPSLQEIQEGTSVGNRSHSECRVSSNPCYRLG